MEDIEGLKNFASGSKGLKTPSETADTPLKTVKCEKVNVELK